MSVYVLGPAIESVVEPEPAVEPVPGPGVGRIGVKFSDANPTQPGGIVNVELLPAANPTDVRPEHVHAIYTTPPDKVPPVAQRTPEWFMGSGSPLGSVPIPQPPLDASGTHTITVAGVVPGIHHVQTVLEYSS
jgi:hypothetical protein